MKRFLTLLLYLTLSSAFIFADSDPSNDTCTGEQISELHSIAAEAAWVLWTEEGTVTDGSDDYDYYYFTPGQFGSITLDYTSTNSTDVIVSTASCGDDSTLNLNNKTSGSATFTVNNTDTVYIRVFAQNTADYSISINFTLTAAPSKDFTCANPKPFTSIFTTNTSGNALIIGNTSLCADDNNDGACEDPGTARNNDIIMINNDVDGDNSTTFNSSAATLAMPADAEVLYAGLHWQGYLIDANDTRKNSAATIKFKYDGSTYNTTTVSESNMNWVYFNASRFYYQGYVDLTAYVQNNGAGKYWVGDIITDTGDSLAGGGFGGWAITVIYKSDTEVFRNMSVYSGYEAIAGSTDITDAQTYATANSCGGPTGVGNNVSTTLTGFLTPKQAPVSSRLTVFAGEGDLSATGDTISITKKDGTAVNLSNAANPGTDVMNASISVDGTFVTSGDPYYSNNSLGIDIDQYDTSAIMDTEQTSTTITLTTSGDGYFPSVYAFTAQLFEPQMCYDYKYSQNQRYFTEDNNGTAAPRIVGSVQEGVNIDVSLYVRNNELSDFSASNLKLSVRDINTTQASYATGSTFVTKANNILPETALIDSSGAGFIKGIDEGDIPALSSTFTTFTLVPSTDSLDMPLDANISYDLILPDGLGGFLPPIRYDSDLGSDKVPMCPTSGGQYTPSWGAYNIEDTGLAGSDYGKYNLYTQVVNRPFSFDVVTYDPDNLTTESNVTMFVGVDMVDVGGYHNIEAACSDPNSAISPTIRMHFTGGLTRITADLNQAVSAGYLSSVNEFYQAARENVAFRVSYLVKADGSGDPIAYTDNNDGTFTMDGFTTVAGQPCAIDPRTGQPKVVQKPNGQPTTLAPVACGNAGTNGVPAAVLDQCLQCITESNVKYACSRDNFAIRPEAFLVKIYDNDESVNPADPTLPIPYTADISAGYQYRYDVNATTHTDESASSGYTETYVVPMLDRNVTYYWRPEAGHIVSGCNDTTNKNPAIYIANGLAVNNLNRSNNIGRYELEMRDSTWTKADQSPAHHTTDLVFNGVTYPAADHYNLNDCALNQSFVPLASTMLNSINIGCTISSSHTNPDRPAVLYSDYNITVHPYDFNLSTVTFNKGMNNTLVPANTNDYVYMNNVIDDSNMSLRYSGGIKAVGANTASLSNFVTDCYAEDIDLGLNTSTLSPLPVTPNFNYRLRENNSSGLVFSDTNGTNAGAAVLPPVTIPASRFTKELLGESDMEFNVNFDKIKNIAVNPLTVAYNRFDVSCSTPANCQSYADMSTTHLPDSNITSNVNITHIYGRLHTPRQRVADPDPTTLPATAVIPLEYEFYCDSATGCIIANHAADPALSPNALLSPDDVRWYQQNEHNISIDGNATATQTRNGADNGRFTTMAININADAGVYTYNGSRGYPYKATIELYAPDWLIYNRYNGNAAANDFELEFFSAGKWAGTDASGMGLDVNTSSNINRRVEW